MPTGYAKARTLGVPVTQDELRHLGRTYVPGGGNGTIFELTRSGGVWTKQVIYSGAPGYAGLAMDGARNAGSLGRASSSWLSAGFLNRERSIPFLTLASPPLIRDKNRMR